LPKYAESYGLRFWYSKIVSRRKDPPSKSRMICRCSIIFAYIHISLCPALATDSLPDVLKDRMIIVNDEQRPSLEFVSLSTNSLTDKLNYLEMPIDPMAWVVQLMLDVQTTPQSNEDRIFLSTVGSTDLNEWLLTRPLLSNPYVSGADHEKGFNQNLLSKDVQYREIRLAKYNYMGTHFMTEFPSQQIESFEYGAGFLLGIGRDMIDFTIEQELGVLNLYADSKKLLEEKNNTQAKKINDPLKQLKGKQPGQDGGFAKFALYLLISLGIASIYSVLAPSGAKGKKSTLEKTEEARRKRWLEKIHQSGWIDSAKYQHLLKNLDILPELIKDIKLFDQSGDPEEDFDKFEDFSNSNKGESVVKIKDTSEDNTSR